MPLLFLVVVDETKEKVDLISAVERVKAVIKNVGKFFTLKTIW